MSTAVEVNSSEAGFCVRFSVGMSGKRCLFLNDIGTFSSSGHAVRFATFEEAREAWERAMEAQRRLDITVIEVVPFALVPGHKP